MTHKNTRNDSNFVSFDPPPPTRAPPRPPPVLSPIHDAPYVPNVEPV